MKKIVRCLKSNYHSRHCHTKCKKMKKFLNPARKLYIDLYQKTVYTATKLGSNFQIKDKTKFDHKHVLVYYVKCSECQEDYIKDRGRRPHERIRGHSGKDFRSHMLDHSLENNQEHVSFENFCMLRNICTNSKFKRKISEALFIKELRPLLNTQEKSVPLLLYID